MTRLVERLGQVLVIAPHPDDEVLGCGGLMARLADIGRPADVAIVTEGKPPAYSAESVRQVMAETDAAAGILGVRTLHRLGCPAAALDRMAHADLNRIIGELVATAAPDTLLLPFPGDIHRDHQLVFEAAMVAARPAGPRFPATILAYETLSETNWNAPGLTPGFVPGVFIDITNGIDRKIQAFEAYQSQVRAFPAERSTIALRALAQLRGATVHRLAAEAYYHVRDVG